jgi:hypothetical protein
MLVLVIQNLQKASDLWDKEPYDSVSEQVVFSWGAFYQHLGQDKFAQAIFKSLAGSTNSDVSFMSKSNLLLMSLPLKQENFDSQIAQLGADSNVKRLAISSYLCAMQNKSKERYGMSKYVNLSKGKLSRKLEVYRASWRNADSFDVIVSNEQFASSYRPRKERAY